MALTEDEKKRALERITALVEAAAPDPRLPAAERNFGGTLGANFLTWETNRRRELRDTFKLTEPQVEEKILAEQTARKQDMIRTYMAGAEQGDSTSVTSAAGETVNQVGGLLGIGGGFFGMITGMISKIPGAGEYIVGFGRMIGSWFESMIDSNKQSLSFNDAVASVREDMQNGGGGKALADKFGVSVTNVLTDVNGVRIPTEAEKAAEKAKAEKAEADARKAQEENVKVQRQYIQDTKGKVLDLGAGFGAAVTNSEVRAVLMGMDNNPDPNKRVAKALADIKTGKGNAAYMMVPGENGVSLYVGYREGNTFVVDKAFQTGGSGTWSEVKTQLVGKKYVVNPALSDADYKILEADSNLPRMSGEIATFTSIANLHNGRILQGSPTPNPFIPPQIARAMPFNDTSGLKDPAKHYVMISDGKGNEGVYVGHYETITDASGVKTVLKVDKAFKRQPDNSFVEVKSEVTTGLEVSGSSLAAGAMTALKTDIAKSLDKVVTAPPPPVPTLPGALTADEKKALMGYAQAPGNQGWVFKGGATPDSTLPDHIGDTLAKIDSGNALKVNDAKYVIVSDGTKTRIYVGKESQTIYAGDATPSPTLKVDKVFELGADGKLKEVIGHDLVRDGGHLQLDANKEALLPVEYDKLEKDVKNARATTRLTQPGVETAFLMPNMTDLLDGFLDRTFGEGVGSDTGGALTGGRQRRFRTHTP